MGVGVLPGPLSTFPSRYIQRKEVLGTYGNNQVIFVKEI